MPRRVLAATIEPYEVITTGSLSDLAAIEDLDQWFDEGDLGELEFFLRDDLSTDDLKDVEEAAAELEATLRKQGALPWPGNDRIVFIYPKDRRLRLLFQQGIPVFLVLAAVLLILASLPIVLKLIDMIPGVTIPRNVTTVAQAVATIAIIAGGIMLLKGIVPLSLLVPGGLLIFAVLNRDVAFRVVKWTTDAAVGAGLGKPLLYAGIAAVGVGAVVALTQQSIANKVLGVAVAAAGGYLAVSSGGLLKLPLPDIGRKVPRPLPAPGRGAITAIESPTLLMEAV